MKHGGAFSMTCQMRKKNILNLAIFVKKNLDSTSKLISIVNVS